MFPLVGMGKFVTAPIITEDGEPIREPIVLQQTNLEDEPVSVSKCNGTEGNSADPHIIQQTKNLQTQLLLQIISNTLILYLASADASSSEVPKLSNGRGPLDKKEIQWKLTLHQIGCQ